LLITLERRHKCLLHPVWNSSEAGLRAELQGSSAEQRNHGQYSQAVWSEAT